jgi:hypothetical protein
MIGRSELWRAVHNDLVDKCAATAPLIESEHGSSVLYAFNTADRDLEVVDRRADTEGDSFFTITLPSFGKEFLRTLDRGCVLSSDFEGWRKVDVRFAARSASSQSEDRLCLPAFLQWATRAVFAASHTCSAEPDLVHPCVVGGVGEKSAKHSYYPPLSYLGYDEDWAAESVHAILQLSGLYSKEKRLCSTEKIAAALDGYVGTDKEIESHLEGEIFPSLLHIERVRKIVTLAFASTLTEVDREVHDGLLLPKHGPGATADSLVGNEKWLLAEWTERLETVFPHGEFLYPNELIHHLSDERIVLRAPGEERPVKVVLVPKTQATPRVIAIEPTCMQYVQQAFMRSLVPKLEKFKSSSSFVGFTDQAPNQKLAAYGSAGGNLATLDLSEASDRVANWLVEELFADFPHFLEGVQACRSTRASLPDGRIITLNKFASMGSALTFPIEAMVFTAIVLEACISALSLPLNARSLRSLRGRVRVYGDDIIVPVETAEQVTESLETFGFKVNRHKSFWTGEFRESCGEEYWRGRDVSHVKVRSAFPTNLGSATEVISTSSTRNQLFESGFVQAVDVLDRVLLRVLKGVYPVVERTSPLVGRLGLERPHADAWDQALHVPLAKGYVPVAKSPVNKLDGTRALLKYFLSPSEEEDHLTRSGRPRVVRMKLAMAPVY